MSAYYDDKSSLFMEPQVKQYGSHMVMTNVNRQIKRKYINIDTKYREEYSAYTADSHAACSICLPEKITDVKTISVKNAEIPITFYNISHDLGNSFLKIVNGTTNSKIIDISAGNYTIATLITELNTRIASLGAPYSNVSFAQSGNNISMKCSTGSLNVIFDVNADGSLDKNNFKRKLGWTLGFRSPSYTLSNNIPVLSENLPDLTGIRYAYLVIDEFSKGTQNSFSGPLPSSLVRKNIIAKISFDSSRYGFGTILPANQTNGLLLSDRRIYTGKIDIQKFNVQLVDDIGNPLHLNGLDFSFCLEVEHE
jgi:hypothetical protein